MMDSQAGQSIGKLMSFDHIIMAACVGAVTLFLGIPLLRQNRQILRWFAKGIRSRDSHQTPTPSIGGLLMFPVLSGVLLYTQSSLFSSAFLLVFYFAILGFLDDALDIAGIKKIFLFFLGVILFLPLMGLLKGSPYEGFGLYFRLLLAIVILFTLINASNTIDGVDLLCCLYFIVNFLALSLLFYKSRATSELQLCAIMVILMVPFAFYNAPKASIFLGDCGSLFLGSLMSLLLIRLFPSNPLGKLHVFLLFGGVAVLDNAVVSISRMLNGLKPWRSDQFHLHHILSKEFGYWSALRTLLITQVSIVLLTSVFILKKPENLMTLFMLAFLIYLGIQVKHFEYMKQRLAESN